MIYPLDIKTMVKCFKKTVCKFSPFRGAAKVIEEFPKLLLAKQLTFSGKPCQFCIVIMVRYSFCLMSELGKVFEKS